MSNGINDRFQIVFEAFNDNHKLFFRFGKPEDISGVVSFLCSEDASYMTGESIVAAGGLLSRL